MLQEVDTVVLMIHHGAKQQTEYSESLLKSKSAISIEDFLYELYKIHVLYSTLFEIATEIDCFILSSWSLSDFFTWIFELLVVGKHSSGTGIYNIL